MFEAAEDGLERIWSGLAESPAATAVVDADGRFLRVNQPMCDLLGHTEPALLATGFPAVLHREDADADLQRLSRVPAGEQPGYRLRQRCRRPDGAVVPVLGGAWLPLSPWCEALHLDRQGRPRYVIRQLVDLRDDATRDALTGLPNRSLLLDRLHIVTARYTREPGLAALLALDIDRFGVVTGRFGHDAVDQLLVAVAGRLRSILRPSDTVARLGGDEFAVLCPGIGRRRDAIRIAERIMGGLVTPSPWPARRWRCRPTSASASPGPGPDRPRRCRSTPTSRSGVPGAGAAATTSPTRRCGRSPSSTCGPSGRCAARWRPASCALSTSRSSRCARAA
jgi:diguanylate cyclase (GGDEF)-like protein/PAS domain S-box-containing protein